MLNIESNQETEAERKDRQARAARFFAKHPLRVPAPGQNVVDSVSAQTGSNNVRARTECPVCAERKRKQAERMARARANRHAN
jgi:hypothetical protein